MSDEQEFTSFSTLSPEESQALIESLGLGVEDETRVAFGPDPGWGTVRRMLRFAQLAWMTRKFAADRMEVAVYFDPEEVDDDAPTS